MPTLHVLSGPLDDDARGALLFAGPVGGDDLRAGRSAPNLEGHAPRTPLEWSRRITDGARLEPPPVRSRAAGA